MIIRDIQDIRTGQTRSDGKYPQRIGSRVAFAHMPEPGTCMYLQYITDNQDNPKSGHLRTSLIKGFQENAQEVIITTLNSRYIFTKESSLEHVSALFD